MTRKKKLLVAFAGLFVVVLLFVAYLVWSVDNSENFQENNITTVESIITSSELADYEVLLVDEAELSEFLETLNFGLRSSGGSSIKNLDQLQINLSATPQQRLGFSWRTESGEIMEAMSSDYQLEDRHLVLDIHMSESDSVLGNIDQRDGYLTSQLIRTLCLASELTYGSSVTDREVCATEAYEQIRDRDIQFLKLENRRSGDN